MSILADPNLIEHWNLDEASGTRFGYLGNHNLTETGGTVDQGTGIVNNCLEFGKGSSGYLSCSTLSAFSFFEIGYTISVWWKRSINSVTYETVWAGYTGRETIRTRATSQLQGRYLGSSWSQFSGTHNGEWRHICQTVSWTGTGSDYNLAAYLDGSSIASTTQSSGTTAFNGFNVGANVEGTEKNLSGSIDHISFYNRGLSALEVAELYNDGTPPTLGGSTPKSKTNLGISL